MNEWTDGMLWALAEKVRARAKGAVNAATLPPKQQELALGPGGNVIPFISRRNMVIGQPSPESRDDVEATSRRQE